MAREKLRDNYYMLVNNNGKAPKTNQPKLGLVRKIMQRLTINISGGHSSYAKCLQEQIRSDTHRWSLKHQG